MSVGPAQVATPAQTALAWLLTRGDDIAPLPGNSRDLADHLHVGVQHGRGEGEDVSRRTATFSFPCAPHVRIWM